jgi:hypothetical protein
MRWARRTLPVTFAVHVTMAAIALWPALALGGALSAATGALGADVTPKGVWFDVLAAGLGGGVYLSFLAATGIALLMGAPVQMAWLFALGGSPGRAAIRRGLVRTPAAWGVSLLVLAFGALALLAALSVPLGAHVFLLRRLHDERLHDLIVGALALPAAISLVGAACAHDRARAALVDPEIGPLEACTSALAALRSTLPALYLGFFVLGASLTLLALDASTRGGTALAASLAMIAAQLLLFGRTFARSLWLTLCVRDASRERRPLD